MWLSPEKDGSHNKNSCKRRRTCQKSHSHKPCKDTARWRAPSQRTYHPRLRQYIDKVFEFPWMMTCLLRKSIVITSKPFSRHRRRSLIKLFSTIMLGFPRCGPGLFRNALFPNLLSGRSTRLNQNSLSSYFVCK